MVPFLFRNRPTKAWPLIETFFKAVREKEGSSLPIGAAGFCWGGKHTVRLAWGESTVNGKPLIDAGFNAHPSLLKIPRDIEKITIPTSFALSENDPAIKAPQIEQIQNAVEAQPEERKGETKIYYGAGHGFAVRADHATKDKERSAAEAEDQAISWFNRWFASVSY
jgi:dienelactone hydrolase